MILNHAAAPINHAELDGEVPVGVAGGQLVPGPRIDERQREGRRPARVGLRRVRGELHGQRALDLLGIVASPPQVLSPQPDRPALGHRPLDLGHVTALADQPSLPREVRPFVFRKGPAGSHVVELEGTLGDLMAAVADLGGTEPRIELRRMRGHRVVERAEDDAVAHVAAGAGDAFLLERLIVVRIRRLDGLLHPTPWNLSDQGRLLIGERSVAVQADPHLAVLPPVGAEEWIGIGLCVIGGLPLLVDLAMALAAVLGFQARDAGRNFLERDGLGEILSQAENNFGP